MKGITVNRLNKQIAKLEAQRLSLLGAERKALQNRLSELDAIAKPVAVKAPTVKVHKTHRKSNGFDRGVVKAAIVVALTGTQAPQDIEAIYTKVTAQKGFGRGKLTLDGFRNNLYALATGKNASIKRVGRGLFTLKNVTAPVVAAPPVAIAAPATAAPIAATPAPKAKKQQPVAQAA
jgi:hypothetical protein